MIKVAKPTTPGRRIRTDLSYQEITHRGPEKSLTRPLKGAVGRSKGRVTVRHRQVGAKKMYRIIDFKRDKRDIPAKVATIEYDPNRGANIALLHYADGEKRYILAPEGLVVGSAVVAGERAAPEVGNSLPLKQVPLGVPIHNIELQVGRGGQLVRGAGTVATILSKEKSYVHVKLPSKEIHKVLADCYATVGAVGNADLRSVKLGKAGRARLMGKRPEVRGVAFSNPRDHPHGGSYSTSGVGMPSPKSPWGWKTRGKKTRSRSQTDKYIVKERKRGKK
ncbi:50S ribosomal protein L2 [Candidatus Parcubacteria bacterium]|nr:50S ribosomal protein L2 [Candidatus Parcubacteria bacterium]